MRSDTQFDVIIIGAGINGAGIARDAAMRGLKVLLLDKGDIGGGTSSLSTRLIHGGLRYLEHGEFGLVRESLRERTHLMNIAPHLIRPLRILVPIYKQARRGFWTIRAGLITYDLLSSDKTLPRHRMLSLEETLEQAPGLNRDGLLGAAVYVDAQVEFAERLVLENVLSAVEHGARVVTYACVGKIIVNGKEARGVEFTRAQNQNFGGLGLPNTGTAGVSPADRCITTTLGEDLDLGSVTARIVINAAGPWIDQVLEAGAGKSPHLIGGTKGSHLIVAPFSGAPVIGIYVEAETDRRPFFIIPWNGNYLIGTTDIRYKGDLDQVEIEAEEIDYLLQETNRVIPHARLTRDRILYTYSGVRPLPFTGDKDEQRITRRHFIRRHPQIQNLFSIVGGKLTTYRSFAEQTVDLICQKLNQQCTESTTARQPLPGAETPDFEAFSKNFKERCGLSATTSEHLLRTYGTRASLILNLIGEDTSLADAFDPETGAIAAEVVFAFRHELAQTLADCLLRRTMVGLNSTGGLNACETAAAIAKKHLDWSVESVDQELAAYRGEISRRFRG